MWEPVTPPAGPTGTAGSAHPAVGVSGPAEALTELLSALARRQHEHRARTADRLEAVVGSARLPDGLQDMARYYLAKVQRDLGRARESAAGMRIVVDGGGRFAPPARRGLVHLARLAGDFPTALEMAAQLGWAGRQHRVEADLHWPSGQFRRAAAAYQQARHEAEQHRVAGEAATSQSMRAFVTALAHPDHAGPEIDLADQLLAPLALRASGFNVALARLAQDAGRRTELPERAEVLRTEIQQAGLAPMAVTVDLVLALHHAVLGDADAAAATVGRLRTATEQAGEYRYFTEIAAFMADLPAPANSPVRWLDAPDQVRSRWRQIVLDRRS